MADQQPGMMESTNYVAETCEHKGIRCICCLPMDLLQLIIERLSILDYLACRSICRCWRSAFVRCPVKFNGKVQEQTHWIVFLRVDNRLQCELRERCRFEQAEALSQVKQTLYTTGKLGDAFTRRVYNFPELQGKQFLLSKYGWLLLFETSSDISSHHSLFFLSPFSSSRINLPYLNVLSLKNPAFAISAPPTSQHCVVFAITVTDNETGSNDMKISVCHRGEGVWATRMYHYEGLRISFVVNIVFVGGAFYCLHQSGHLSAFNVLNSRWCCLMESENMKLSGINYTSTLRSQALCHAGDVLLCIACDGPPTRRMIKLKDPPEFLCDGHLANLLFDYERRLLFKTKDAVLSLGNDLILDSVSIQSWFGLCDFREGGLTFCFPRFRRWPSIYKRLEVFETIAWLEPCWIQQNASWTETV